MIDYGTLVRVNRLQRTVDWLSTVIDTIAGGASGIGRISNYVNLRQQTTSTLNYITVLVMEDANGDAGIYNYSSSSTAADDGVNVIVDTSSRRWLRVGSPL